ncbi:MAG: biotin/lipoyl-binding protein, partial [Candidatus Dormibacteraeota bacterium]|nr:biotin/lipoyl-binding protein [Candidatus Dormibacteraeota bacterium]
MADVNMPKLSDTMEEGTVLTWKVQEGDQVKRGDVLAEVESDKASFDLEAEASGYLHIVVDQGKPVPVGDLIARIGDSKEAPREAPEPSAQTATEEPAAETPAAEAPEGEPTKAEGGPATAEAPAAGAPAQPEAPAPAPAGGEERLP